MAEDLRRSEQEIRAVWDSEVFQAVSKTNGVQAIDWDLMWGLPPHKIFLWDRRGTYLDCQFPNPIHGHFFGGAKLCGTTIADVLPQKDSEALLMAIRQALVDHRPTMVHIDMTGVETSYHTIIRILPMQEFVIGWVNDFPAQAHPRPGWRTHQKEFKPASEHLTGREWEIANCIAHNKSNEQIADLLNISQRTVKFHVSHVLEKLHATRRAQVQRLIPLLQKS